MRAERMAHPIEAYADPTRSGWRVVGLQRGHRAVPGARRTRQRRRRAAGGGIVRRRRDNPPDFTSPGKKRAKRQRAGVGRLVITHVPPWHGAATAASEAADVFSGPIDVATAGMTLDVSR